MHRKICQMEAVRSAGQWDILAVLAGKIWREYFPSVIGSAQTEYMIDRFQSRSAMKRQCTEGYEYYFITVQGEETPMGYVCIREEKEQKRLFLSKLYLKKEARGQGYASQIMLLLKELCQIRGLHSVYLTVNRDNLSTIAVYRHLGFVTVKEQKVDIGGGFAMDDFVMERIW